MIRGRVVTAAAGLAGIAACWLASAAVRGLDGVPGVPLDAAWARAAHAGREPVSIEVSEVLARLGGAPGSIVVTAALGLLLLRRRGPRSAAAFVLAAAVDQALVTGMKLLDQRPGPSGAVFEGRGSFPSGHTAFAAVIAVALVLAARSPWARAAAVALVPLMAVSRTVIDAHWLTDTVAGAACGASTAAVVAAALAPGRDQAGSRRIVPRSDARSG